MAMAVATSKSFLRIHLHHHLSISNIFLNCTTSSYRRSSLAAAISTKIKKEKKRTVPVIVNGGGSDGVSSAKEGKLKSLERVKRRTRSEREFDVDSVIQHGDIGSHVPVMLGEVLQVFSSSRIRSFVDCTLGAAGHSAAIIQAHSELHQLVGLDVDPVAHERARGRITGILNDDSDLKVHLALKNFRNVKSVLKGFDENLFASGVDGMLMDLGMSSMQVNNAERGFSVLGDGPLDMRMDPQATLTAEDILNFWPETEIGRILRDYGEESSWYYLQNKIVKTRLDGGLHSTSELADLIRNTTSRTKGRQGWIKTATRVFQALRIAVNDELKTLEDSLYACFDCLAPGGRLAVISFHSLEDRIVKQTFLDIINEDNEDDERLAEKKRQHEQLKNGIKEAWIKQMIEGRNGIILTKRPITPSQEEEQLNRRSRSAKLRVIQKL